MRDRCQHYSFGQCGYVISNEESTLLQIHNQESWAHEERVDCQFKSRCPYSQEKK